MQNEHILIIEQLRRFDEIINSRAEKDALLDAEYADEQGNILGKDLPEYRKRKETVQRVYEKSLAECHNTLNSLCRAVRYKQPAIQDLTADAANLTPFFPDFITLNKFKIKYKDFDHNFPKCYDFPFEKPMYYREGEDVELLHKALLRLMFALPADRQEYCVYDPIGLGASVNKFNALFDAEKLFPQKKILTQNAELKGALTAACEYILELQSGVFNIGNGCGDWLSYNRMCAKSGETIKMLPYKVFVLTSVPARMDEESFNMFKTLLRHHGKCGILVIYSYDPLLPEIDEVKLSKYERELKEIVKDGIHIRKMFDPRANLKFDNLRSSHVSEAFPDDAYLDALLNDFKKVLGARKEEFLSFDEIQKYPELFAGDATDGLSVPIGAGVSRGATVSAEIDDQSPHYLIGGMTGSGKSNLLHNLILSASLKYSPKQLQIYLLDFKEGVEFAQYASPCLNHAALVATEADTEYGVSVLKHLTLEKEKRYAEFKKFGCKDIQGYREKRGADSMSRLLVIIDEFQVLFDNENKADTMDALYNLAKQGRACGIHLILATQSLKGIDTTYTGLSFTNVAPQFAGRIALRCSADDSKLLLGDNYSNTEASELKIPYAILNTSQGNASGNTRFAVPKSDGKLIRDKVTDINKLCEQHGIVTETKVFNGSELPKRMPVEPNLDPNSVALYLGETLSYDANPLSIVLKNRRGQNLLIVGHDDFYKRSLLNSVIIGALSDPACDEVIYVGVDGGLIDAVLSEKIGALDTLKEFYEKYKDAPFDKKRMLIIDNINLETELGWPAYTGGRSTPEADFFKDIYFEKAPANGSHIVAFYESEPLYKSSRLPQIEFIYNVGYNLNKKERDALISEKTPETVKANRAFIAENACIRSWFRPFDPQEEL